jgi:iron-sulfur cluster repair protein YtfE (RIC family)
MDAITLLKKDHAAVKELFKQVEDLGERATATRKKLCEKIDYELRMHSMVEEQIFYPAFKERAEDTEERNEVLEAYEEHSIVETVLDELKDLAPTDETYAPKMQVLMELVKHHIKEEEGTLFPMARDVFEREDLTDLGERIQEAKAGGLEGTESGRATAKRSSHGEVQPAARSSR